MTTAIANTQTAFAIAPEEIYRKSLATAQRINWKVEDVIGGDRRLDFARPFLPEALARVEPLAFLKAGERHALNQIRALGYLVTFGLVEEFILPFVLDRLHPIASGGDVRTRALLQFAGEEAKHIELFRRFRDEFDHGFGHTPETLGPPEAIAREVLGHHPLGVALAILHIEWMTQRHFLDSVRDDGGLDAQFKSLLKHHWMEEAQHARLDAALVREIAEGLTPSEIEAGVEEYLAIGAFLDRGLSQQVELDLTGLAVVTGRELAGQEREAAREVQLGALRWTFLGSGMTHPAFLATVEAIHPASRDRIEALGRQMS